MRKMITLLPDWAMDFVGERIWWRCLYGRIQIGWKRGERLDALYLFGLYWRRAADGWHRSHY